MNDEDSEIYASKLATDILKFFGVTDIKFKAME